MGKGVKRHLLDEHQIQQRALLGTMNKAAALMPESVASRPKDIDVALENGYGFPRWEGGSVFSVRQCQRAKLERDMDWFAALSGPGFVRQNPSTLFLTT